MERTIEEFVEDMITDNKTFKQIIIVAQNTHWEPKIEEIKECLKKYQKFLK